MKIAIQGAAGSFHHLAARHYYGEGHDFVWCETFHEVFTTLREGRAARALTAIENSLYGSITEVYDLLQANQVPVVGEVVEHIHQNLIGFDDTPLPDIKKVYSHPVALAQCAAWLEENIPDAEIIEYHDTAAAVDFVKTCGDHTIAAIAGTAAADLHQMEILAHDIQDEKRNYTRFLVLEPDGSTAMDSDKASIILTTSHRPGALYGALGVFTELGCNLTKLQSRPIIGKVWHYQFYIDIEITPQQLAEAVKHLEAQECEVLVLGAYKAAVQQYDD